MQKAPLQCFLLMRNVSCLSPRNHNSTPWQARSLHSWETGSIFMHHAKNNYIWLVVLILCNWREGYVSITQRDMRYCVAQTVCMRVFLHNCESMLIHWRCVEFIVYNKIEMSSFRLNFCWLHQYKFSLNDKFQCSQWWQFCQNGNISISMDVLHRG